MPPRCPAGNDPADAFLAHLQGHVGGHARASRSRVHRARGDHARDDRPAPPLPGVTDALPSASPRRQNPAARPAPGLSPCSPAAAPARTSSRPSARAPDLVWQAADLNRYRDKSASATKDIRDLILSGRIVGIDRANQMHGRRHNNGTRRRRRCPRAVDPRPGHAGPSADVEYFLAVTENGNIVDKQVYQSPVVFPPNVDQVTLSSQVVHMVFPVGIPKPARPTPCSPASSSPRRNWDTTAATALPPERTLLVFSGETLP